MMSVTGPLDLTSMSNFSVTYSVFEVLYRIMNPVSRKGAKLGLMLVLNTNMKSYMGVQWHHKI